MYRGVIFMWLWALAGTSHIRDSSEDIHPHIHVPKKGNVSLNTAETELVQGAIRPTEIAIGDVKEAFPDSPFVERLLRSSGRNQNEKERRQPEHRKLDLALTSLNLFKTKLKNVPPESRTFTRDGNTVFGEYVRRGWKELYNDSLGVSYARFEYLGMNLRYKNVSKASVTVTLTIANVGDAQGDEVVECYMSWANKSLPVPREQLVYFDRIHLEVNQTTQYAFILTWMSWAFWSNGTWVVQTGYVTLCCGDQQPQQMAAPNVLCSQFSVIG